jgi:hypothetical protein
MIGLREDRKLRNYPHGNVFAVFIDWKRMTSQSLGFCHTYSVSKDAFYKTPSRILNRLMRAGTMDKLADWSFLYVIHFSPKGKRRLTLLGRIYLEEKRNRAQRFS